MRFLLTLIVAAVVVWFWYDNAGLLAQEVPLALRLPFVELRPFPPLGPRIDVLLAVVFLSGFLLAYALSLTARVRALLKIRHLKRELKDASASASVFTNPPRQEDA